VQPLTGVAYETIKYCDTAELVVTTRERHLRNIEG
jgi:hypothetical protein